MDAPPGYNPNVSVFQGGDTAQITPMQGGALSIAQLLAMGSPQTAAINPTSPESREPLVSSQPTDKLLQIPQKDQPAVAAAAAIAAMGASVRPGGNMVSATEAGVSAALQVSSQLKPALEAVNISNDDNKLLLTARAGDEQQGSLTAGVLAYDAAMKAGKSESEADAAVIKASVDYIKKYRETNPYDDSTISMDVSKSEAQELLNTTDPKEKEVGKKAYDTAYSVAIKRGNSPNNARDYAIVAQVNAIKAYREKPKATVVATTITEAEATEIFNTSDPTEKELGELATRKAIEDAKKRRVPSDRWQAIGIIAAAERIQLYRGDKKVVQNVKKRPLINSTLVGAIKRVSDLPLYIEYSEITNNLKNPYVEIYEKRTAEASVGNTFKMYMTERITNYQAAQTEKWARASQTATLPQTHAKKAFVPGEIITSFSRLTHILPITTENIIVLPPINGNVNNFMKALQTLDEMGIIDSKFIIKKDTVIVCTAPFYKAKADPLQITRNNILLSFVLDIISANQEQWFTLAEHNADGYLVGSTFVGRTPNDLLINMIEPSYVVYPYRRRGIEGIIMTTSTGVSLPADAANKVSLNNVYSNKLFGKVQRQVYKPSLKNEGAPGFFTVNGSLNPMKIPDERVGGCGLANYSLPEQIPTLHPSKKIGLSTNVKGTGIILAFRLQIKGNYEPLCATGVIVKDNSKKFVGSPEAYINPADVQTTFFEVAGKALKIRKTNKLDKVYNNWKRGIYTDSEAELLNLLHLSPSIMEKIFPLTFNDKGDPISVPWKDWVANFLATVTIKNKSLTTHRETMIIRNFLERVRAYFISTGLKKDLDENDSDNDTALQHGLLEPDGVDDLDKEDLRDIKREWGKLDIYEDKANSEWISTVVLVNKNTYKQLYKTIGVPTEQYNRVTAKTALENKITTLKRKYPDWIFIY